LYKHNPNGHFIEIRQVTKRLDELLLREELMWRQRSRITWLAEGDQNTKFFHRRATWRAKKNSIKSLVISDDCILQKKEDILEYSKDYFSALFTKDQHVEPTQLLDIIDTVVTIDMNESLTREFSKKEILNSLFQIGPLKAPGPDGFPARFFQRNWAALRHDVIRIVKDFLCERNHA
jgi:hypothetical protein